MLQYFTLINYAEAYGIFTVIHSSAEKDLLKIIPYVKRFFFLYAFF